MKTKIALLLSLVTVLIAWPIVSTRALRNTLEQRDAEWRKAAQPIFDARRISGKNTSPRDLAHALDANHPFHNHELWLQALPKASTVIEIYRKTTP